ncbi:MAG: HIT domain-containing protein [Bacteroidales bacterium]
MDNKEKDNLANMVLAPWIQKATALRGEKRFVGGNQFRHSMSTLAVLIDYHYTYDPVLLKAAIVHDLKEDVPETDIRNLQGIDKDSPKVIELMLQVTRNKDEDKSDFLKRIKEHGSTEAKIIKVADRISNMTDLHKGIFDKSFIKNYIYETEHHILPMAIEVNEGMAFEIGCLIKNRKELINDTDVFYKRSSSCIFCKIADKEAPATILYENKKIISFLDIMPVNKGHILISPVNHFESFTEISDEVISEMFSLAKRLDIALRKSEYAYEAVNLFIADGTDAGQEVPHVHLHIIPRVKDDGFGLKFPANYSDKPGKEELFNIGKHLKMIFEKSF